MKKILSLFTCLILLFCTAMAEPVTDSDLTDVSGTETDVTTATDLDPEDNNPYYLGAQEMHRQLEMRSYSPGYRFSSRSSSSINLFGNSEPQSYDGYPNGIILDEDFNCVLVAADDCVLILYCNEEPQSLEIMAGSAFMASLYCNVNNQYPTMWVHKDGVFIEKETQDAAKEWAHTYMQLVEPIRVLPWSSLCRFEDVNLDTIGRLLSCRNAASIINDWDVMDGLLYTSLPDTIIVLEEDCIIIVQSAQHTWLFAYDEGCYDTAMTWAVFHVLMGGVQLWDMYALDVDENGQAEWLTVDKLGEIMNEIYDVWYSWPSMYTDHDR